MFILILLWRTGKHVQLHHMSWFSYGLHHRTTETFSWNDTQSVRGGAHPGAACRDSRTLDSTVPACVRAHSRRTAPAAADSRSPPPPGSRSGSGRWCSRWHWTPCRCEAPLDRPTCGNLSPEVSCRCGAPTLLDVLSLTIRQCWESIHGGTKTPHIEKRRLRCMPYVFKNVSWNFHILFSPRAAMNAASSRGVHEKLPTVGVLWWRFNETCSKHTHIHTLRAIAGTMEVRTAPASLNHGHTVGRVVRWDGTANGSAGDDAVRTPVDRAAVAARPVGAVRPDHAVRVRTVWWRSRHSLRTVVTISEHYTPKCQWSLPCWATFPLALTLCSIVGTDEGRTALSFNVLRPAVVLCFRPTGALDFDVGNGAVEAAVHSAVIRAGPAGVVRPNLARSVLATWCVWWVWGRYGVACNVTLESRGAHDITWCCYVKRQYLVKFSRKNMFSIGTRGQKRSSFLQNHIFFLETIM